MTHPYKAKSDKSFWKRQVSLKNWDSVFADETGLFKIKPTDVICTSGSCFANRISKYIKEHGYNFGDFEKPHPLISDEVALKLGYGQFSTRSGNIYTTRQLKQLVEEALGYRKPIFTIERAKSGFYKDLLRPTVQGDGFSAPEECQADREFHLSCVQNMLKTQDIFIFTLGLTEAWHDPLNDIVFGIHPSVTTGCPTGFDVTAVNFDYSQCYNDLLATIAYIREINPSVKIILTVSPVSLAATHQDKHVLLATSYSKSVLRAASGKITEDCANVDYFPSFEIFTSAQSFGQYLSEDLRDVNKRGIDATMKLFSRYYFANDEKNSVYSSINDNSVMSELNEQSEDNKTDCDEILNSLIDSR